MNTDCLKICILDTETTGLPINNDYSKLNIIEIGWIVVNKNLDILKKETMLIKGDFVINDFISNLTGISKEMTERKGISIKNALEKLYNDINECQFIMAHNVVFDYNMILTEIKNIFKNDDNNYLEHYLNLFKSKIRLCSKYILKQECEFYNIKVENFKLDTLYKTIVDNTNTQTHRAINDVYMILECLQSFDDDLDILYYFWQKKILFGKYKNKTHEWIYDNDRDYFDWLIRTVYNINTTNKKDELCYKNEEYVFDDFVVADNDFTMQDIVATVHNDYQEISDDTNDSDYQINSTEEESDSSDSELSETSNEEVNTLNKRRRLN